MKPRDAVTRADIVSIGDEVVDGRVLNSNAYRLAVWLEDRGVRIRRHVSVVDDEAEIAECFLESSRRSEIVIASGGLGPTEDDRTRHAAARAAGVDLVFEPAIWEAIDARFRARGFATPESNRLQALFPRGAEILANPNGTAPGFAMTLGGALVIALPGVPAELVAMLETSVEPRLAAGGFLDRRPRLERFRIYGLSESGLQDLVRSTGSPPPSVTVRFRVDAGEIELDFVLAAGAPPDEHRGLDEFVGRLESALGMHVVGRDGTPLVEVVVRRLVETRTTIAVAESCTGGLIGHLLTEVPGVSAVFLEDSVTYANAAKVRRLGVAEADLTAHGAVSEAVVRAMAVGIREVAGADLGLATSGILGPGGGSEAKPVGLVWTALASPGGVEAWSRQLPGDRSLRKVFAAKHALDRVRRYLG